MTDKNTLATITGTRRLPARADIDREAVKDRIEARSANTRKNYESRVADFNAFRGELPISDETIRAFLNDLADRINPRTGETVRMSTVHAYATAIRADLKAFGKEHIFGVKAQAALRRIQREKSDAGQVAPKQAKALNWADVNLCARIAEKSGLTVGWRDSAMIRVMSDGLLRISELVALDVEDIRENDNGTGTVMIKRSKTDQTGEGAYIGLGKPTMDAIRTYTQRADIHDGALFRRIWKGGNNVSDYRISINGARHAIQAATRAAGIDGISGHSARVGSAQDLVKQGATLPDLMQVGRWEDEKMPARYSKEISAEDNAIMRLKYGK